MGADADFLREMIGYDVQCRWRWSWLARRGVEQTGKPKLGHLDQEGERGGFAHARYADQDVEAGLQLGIVGMRSRTALSMATSRRSICARRWAA